MKVDGETRGRIGPGLAVLLGVATGDGDDDARYVAGKLARLRIFSDPDGKMNLSVKDTGGSVLLVSQFTLLGETRRGNRPCFSGAAPAEQADRLYQEVAAALRGEGIEVATGVFGTMMELSLVNDGPVTILMDSR